MLWRGLLTAALLVFLSGLVPRVAGSSISTETSVTSVQVASETKADCGDCETEPNCDCGDCAACHTSFAPFLVLKPIDAKRLPLTGMAPTLLVPSYLDPIGLPAIDPPISLI